MLLYWSFYSNFITQPKTTRKLSKLHPKDSSWTSVFYQYSETLSVLTVILWKRNPSSSDTRYQNAISNNSKVHGLSFNESICCVAHSNACSKASSLLNSWSAGVVFILTAGGAACFPLWWNALQIEWKLLTISNIAHSSMDYSSKKASYATV